MTVPRRGALALLAGAGLAGCGFRLRGAPSFAFERLHLAGFDPRSPLREALEAQLPRLPLHRLQKHRLLRPAHPDPR